jgi:calcineurin-like phosphoesterase family protein
MYFFLSDTHFGHENIIKYCNRPFTNVKEMDETIIKNINDRVAETDTLFFLGDFCMKRSSEASSAPQNAFDYYRNQIKCKNIIFIRGNHDHNNGTKTIIQSLIIEHGGCRIFVTHDPKYAKEDFKLNFCTTPDTEILTENGWKKYNKISIGENVMTYNKIKRKKEYNPLKKINIFNYDGNMIHIKHKKIDALFTPDHNVVLNNGLTKKAADLKTFDRLLLNTKKLVNTKIVNIPNKNWAELIGFIIGDGSYCYYNKKLYAIRIHQTSKSYKAKKYLPKLLKSCKINYSKKLHKNLMNVFYISINKNKKFLDYISRYCPNKNLNRDLLNLSRYNLNKLYNGLVMSDGRHYIKNQKLWQHKYSTIKLFEELIVKIGRRFHTSLCKSGFKPKSKNYCIDVSEKNTALLINHKNIINEPYKGIVWCPTVENGTWIAKRNGRAFITGNCGHAHEKWLFRKLGKKSIICNLSIENYNYYPTDINEIQQAYSIWLKSRKTK